MMETQCACYVVISGGRLASREKRVAEDEADGTIIRCNNSQFFGSLSVSIGANVFQELLRREKRMSEKEARTQLCHHSKLKHGQGKVF